MGYIPLVGMDNIPLVGMDNIPLGVVVGIRVSSWHYI